VGLPAGADRAVTPGGARRALIALVVCAAGGLVPPAAPAFAGTGDDDHRHGYGAAARPAPLCTARFCVHWVESTSDAPGDADADADGTPDEVEGIASAFEATYEAQTSPDGLGWREPPRDGTVGGGLDKIDVYVKSGPFRGRTWHDSTGGRSQAAYVLVAPRQTHDVLRFVVAHEFAHVLQYGYDASAPHWLYEATATWVEAKLVPELDSWQRHLTAWAQQTELTVFSGAKGYGSAVWLHWLDGRYGAGIVRAIWEELTEHPAETGDLDAMDAVLRAHGSHGLADEYGRFAAALPEWRLAGSGFPRASTLPDVERRGTLVPDAPAGPVDGRRGSLTLVDVPADGLRSLRLEATLPHGLPGTIALVGRTGPAETGRAITSQLHLPGGGAGAVTLSTDEPLARVTAVFVDAHQYTLEPEPPPPTARVVTLARAPVPTPAAATPAATPAIAFAARPPPAALQAPRAQPSRRAIARRPLEAARRLRSCPAEAAERRRIRRRRSPASSTARRWTRCRSSRSSTRRGRGTPSASQG
jgi:hypothetical protein